MNSEYSPQSEEEVQLLDEQEKGIHDKLRICKQVRDTLSSPGWRNIILPSLDRMISEEVGGKLGNNWVYGKIQDEKSTDKIWFHVGKKQGLLEFHNHIYNYNKMITILENRLKGVTEERKGNFQVPMMEVQYATQEEAKKAKEEVTHATKKRKVKRRKSTRKGNSKRTKKRRVQKGNK